jgi:hypothetical protein
MFPFSPKHRYGDNLGRCPLFVAGPYLAELPRLLARLSKYADRAYIGRDDDSEGKFEQARGQEVFVCLAAASAPGIRSYCARCCLLRPRIIYREV